MRLYNFLLWCLIPVVICRLLWKSRKNPAYRQNITERFGFKLPTRSENTLWVHTVSVGEFLAARPLLLTLLEKKPTIHLWLTCTTPTGREQIIAFQKQYPKRVTFSYFPYDLPFIIKKALTHIQPRAIILMETEIWANLITQAKEKNIPILLINARLSARSLRGYYRYARRLLKKPLQWLKINAQTQQDARRFQVLGTPRENITITTNLKYQIPPACEIPSDLQTLKNESFQWIAASTHSGEEEIILAAHQILQKENSAAKLIIAPRHPERRQEITALVKKYGFTPILRSKKQLPQTAGEVFILDSLGELSAVYTLVDIAFIGGSLFSRGGHNPLEALHAGKPVIFGKSMFNFQQIRNDLIKQSFAKQLTTCQPEELAQTLQALENQNVAANIATYIKAHENIVTAHANFILKHIGEKRT